MASLLPRHVADADPAALAAGMIADLAALAQLRIRWIRPLERLPRPAPARATGRPRVTLVVAGVRRVQAPIDGRIVTIDLAAGDALAVAPRAWTRPLPSPPHRFLAIDCHDDGTRFVRDQPPAADGRRLPTPSGAIGAFHGGVLHAAAWNLLAALVHLGDGHGSAAEARRGEAPVLFALALRVALLDCAGHRQVPRATLDWSRARAWALDHLGSGRDELAAIAGVHPQHLSRLCRRMEGIGLLRWLTGLRMRRAHELLAAGLDLDAAMAACGYGDRSHFRRIFRRVYGCTPGSLGARQIRPTAGTG